MHDCKIVDNLQGRERGPGVASDSSWKLASVQRSTIADVVVRELRRAIVAGDIAQGEQLREEHMARMLGTGRSVVREALRQLVQEGLVEYMPHRGSFVRLLSLDDRLDVYAAREAIESGAAMRALRSAEPLDLSRMRTALAALAAAVDASDRVSEALIGADVDFHRELVALAGSPRLSRAHETLAAETRMLLRHHPAYPAADYIGDHTRLLEALERKDPRTPALVAEHLRLSARLIGGELARHSGEHI